MIKTYLFNLIFSSFILILLCSCNYESTEQSESASQGVKRLDSWWQQRHNNILATDKSAVKILFLGDSITQSWENPNFGFIIWQQYYGQSAINMGFSGDKTQHLLWRIEHGEIDNMSPEYTILLIGTNNAEDYTADEIANGVNAIIDVIEEKLPNTHLILHRIFPRGEVTDPLREVTNAASILFSRRANRSDKITHLDINAFFVDGQGNIPSDIMLDGVHPSTKGYATWANALSYYISP
jgi:beta-glucosidase